MGPLEASDLKEDVEKIREYLGWCAVFLLCIAIGSCDVTVQQTRDTDTAADAAGK